MHALIIVGQIVAGALVALVLAGLLGMAAGIFEAFRATTFKNQAARRARKLGQEFLILAGTPELVDEMYNICIATSRRAEEIAKTKQEGITIDERGSNTTPSPEAK